MKTFTKLETLVIIIMVTGRGGVGDECLEYRKYGLIGEWDISEVLGVSFVLYIE